MNSEWFLSKISKKPAWRSLLISDTKLEVANSTIKSPFFKYRRSSLDKRQLSRLANCGTQFIFPLSTRQIPFVFERRPLPKRHCAGLDPRTVSFGKSCVAQLVAHSFHNFRAASSNPARVTSRFFFWQGRFMHMPVNTAVRAVVRSHGKAVPLGVLCLRVVAFTFL